MPGRPGLLPAGAAGPGGTAGISTSTSGPSAGPVDRSGPAVMGPGGEIHDCQAQAGTPAARLRPMSARLNRSKACGKNPGGNPGP